MHIFNYSDFIWANGSLANITPLLENNDVFAALGFCILVDETTIKPSLHALKSGDRNVIELSSHQAVTLALEHLHSETKLRRWNGDALSITPSYLYWEVPQEGIVLRAFHQTLLAAAPTKGSKIYNGV